MYAAAKPHRLLTCTLCDQSFTKNEMAVHLVSDEHRVLAKLTVQPKDKPKRTKTGDFKSLAVHGVVTKD